MVLDLIWISIGLNCFAFGLGALASLFEFLWKPGKPLAFYGRFLAHLEVGKIGGNGIPKANFFWKPLGGCMVCFTFWLALLFYIPFVLLAGLSWPVALLFILPFPAMAIVFYQRFGAFF